jgi:hypothetical protein
MLGRATGRLPARQMHMTCLYCCREGVEARGASVAHHELGARSAAMTEKCCQALPEITPRLKTLAKELDVSVLALPALAAILKPIASLWKPYASLSLVTRRKLNLRVFQRFLDDRDAGSITGLALRDGYGYFSVRSRVMRGSLSIYIGQRLAILCIGRLGERGDRQGKCKTSDQQFGG